MELDKKCRAKGMFESPHLFFQSTGEETEGEKRKPRSSCPSPGQMSGRPLRWLWKDLHTAPDVSVLAVNTWNLRKCLSVGMWLWLITAMERSLRSLLWLQESRLHRSKKCSLQQLVDYRKCLWSSRKSLHKCQHMLAGEFDSFLANCWRNACV